ncbi:hypothetical protein ABK040_002407 [Willaertia magna]
MPITISFSINNTKHTVIDPDPTLLLVDYLHHNNIEQLHGTKRSCGEGYCGSCTLVMQNNDNETLGDLKYLNINSCLKKVIQCDNQTFYTVEYFANLEQCKKELGLSEDIPKLIAHNNGVQCGFCTTGIVSSLACYALNNEKQDRQLEDIESLLDGHYCRCTGIRPIAFGAKKLAKCSNAKEEKDTPPLVVVDHLLSRQLNSKKCSKPKEEGEGYKHYLNGSLSHGKVTVCTDPNLTGEQEVVERMIRNDDDIASDTNEEEVVQIHEKKAKCKKNKEKQCCGNCKHDENHEHHEHHHENIDILFETTNCSYYIRGIETIEKLEKIMNEQVPSHEQNQKKIKFVCANTSEGVIKRIYHHPSFEFDISKIRELNTIKYLENYVHIGANCSIRNFISILKDDVFILDEKVKEYLSEFLHRIGGTQLRNVASMGGNIAIARNFSYPSDLCIVLATLQAEVDVVLFEEGVFKNLSIPFEQFLNDYGIVKHGQLFIVKSVRVPYQPNMIMGKCFKAAKRITMSESIINSGFSISKLNNGEYNVFIGFMVKHNLWGKSPFRIMKDTMDFVKNNCDTLLNSNDKSVLLSLLQNIVNTLEKEFEKNTQGMTQKFLDYQKRVSVGHFLKFVLETLSPRIYVPEDEFEDFFLRRKQEVVHGAQSFSVYNEFNQPIVKKDALILAQGKGVYAQNTDIIDQHFHTYHANYILSDKPFHQFHIEKEEIEKDFKDVHVVSATELMEHGLLNEFDMSYDYNKKVRLPGIENVADSKTVRMYGNTVFAEDFTLFVGQPLALILAKSSDYLKHVVLQIRLQKAKYIKYSETPCMLCDEHEKEVQDVKLPVFNVIQNENLKLKYDFLVDHVVRNLDFDNPVVDWNKLEQESNLVSVKGVAETSAQSHSYIEPQTSIARPTDTGGLHVISSTQSPKETQEQICNMIGLPMNEVSVECPRLGGAFGGKGNNHSFIALAASAAAYIIKKRVSLIVDKDIDALMLGKRHPYIGDFEIAADKSGKIKALDLNYKLDAGCTMDCSFLVAFVGVFNAASPYFIDTFVAKASCYFTNKATNTAMRSFGAVQSHFVSETAIESVIDEIVKRKYEELNNFSYDEYNNELYKSKYDMRLLNFYKEGQPRPHGEIVTKFNLVHIWREIGQTYFEWVKQANEFNKTHTWKKQGVSIVPQSYSITINSIGFSQSEASVLVSATDGSIVLTTGAVEMGQGIHSKFCQVASQILGVPPYLIKIKKFDTSCISNPTPSGASTTTDIHGPSIKKVCEYLRDALSTKVKQWISTYEQTGKIPSIFNGNNERLFMKLKQLSGSKTNPSGIWLLSPSIGEEEEERDLLSIWKLIVKQANMERTQLMFTAHAIIKENMTEIDVKTGMGEPTFHQTYSAAVCLTEVDFLTGEVDCRKVRLMYDIGKSLNPAIDIGQIEGGFIQGAAQFLQEEVEYCERTGVVKHNGLIPMIKNVPAEFIVDMWPTKDTPKEILERSITDREPLMSAKAIGEPPVILSVGAFFAVRDAVRNFREQGKLIQRVNDFNKAPTTIFRVLSSNTNENKPWNEYLSSLLKQ